MLCRSNGGLICSAGYPTFMLTYWTRDRDKGELLPIEQVVRWMTLDTATVVGLKDRGVLAPGYKADVNIIYYDNLKLDVPKARSEEHTSELPSLMRTSYAVFSLQIQY